MRWMIIVATFTLICLGVYIVFATYRVRKNAKKKQEDINWVYDQLDRALKLIESKSPQEICVGLQMLSSINDPDARMKALRRVADLKHHENRFVAEQAGVTIEKLSGAAR